jgi:ClpP class serine protease
LAIEQAIVNELHDLFVSVVAEGREMDEAEVLALADGRPYTGQQALDLGLVDGLGSLSDAISDAAEIAGIEGEPQVLKYRHTPSLLETWLGAQQSRQTKIALPEWLDAPPVVPQMRYLGP